MYTSFFGLQEKPFAITPDPRYLYLSERHAEALAHLLYGINEAGGFIQLTGEVGTGKTTIIRSLLEQLPATRRRRADPEPAGHTRRIPAHHLRRAAHPGARTRPRQRQAPDGPDRPPTARHPRARTARGADRRRGAEPECAHPRAGAAAHQSRDGDDQAAADHPDRSARAAGSPRTAGTAPARAAHHRPVSPQPAVLGGNRGLRQAPHARRRRHRRGVHTGLARGGSPALGRRAANHQRDLRSRAARRIHARGPPRERQAGARRRDAGLRPADAGALAALGDHWLNRGSARARGRRPLVAARESTAGLDRRNGRRRGSGRFEPDRSGGDDGGTAASAAVLRRGTCPTRQRHHHRGCARQAVCVLGRNLRSERRPRL